jgi:carboxylesterase type B
LQIHGGSFRYGSSKTDVYGPDYLLEKDVIVVSFNYRLGVFGFLSLEDESLNIPGNAGLKDQVFALKWIKNNIQNFGGDPENVTLFGEC